MVELGNAAGLDGVLAPRAVAVVGVSRERGGIGAEIFHNLITSGFQGPVYPVNVHADWVQSVKAYATVTSIPGAVDLVVVATPASSVTAVVDDCIAKGVKGVVVVTSGFAENGADARSRQQILAGRCRDAGIRLVGPNCLGVINTSSTVRLNATFGPVDAAPGSVAFATQSGGPALAAIDHARRMGIGISELVSMGNKADVSGNDLIARWRDDDVTRVILLYLESFGNPRRFLELARQVSRIKPIIAVKAGRTVTGARAASSHTAALAGSDTPAAALLAQAGVIRVDSTRELLETASVLALQPVPAGRRTAIITNAGGLGIMAADACAGRGLLLPEPEPRTSEELRKILPSGATKNPIDLGAAASPETYERVLSAVLDSDTYDSAIALLVPTAVTATTEVTRGIARGATGMTKPIVTAIVGVHAVEEARRYLADAGFPAFGFPEEAVAALGHAADYGAWRAAHADDPLPPPWHHQAAVRRVIDRAKERLRRESPDVTDGWMSPAEAHDLLESCGIVTPRSEFVETVDAAVVAADTIGYPVVTKVVSPKALHKTEVGGVRLELPDGSAVRAACRAMADRVGGNVEGFVVQEMVESGTELLMGMSRDHDFGPLIAFGSGGVHTELLADAAFRIAPLSQRDAMDLVDGMHSQVVLDGFRGAPRVDCAAAVKMLLTLSALAANSHDLMEVDLNPVVATPRGRLVALDARIRLRCA